MVIGWRCPAGFRTPPRHSPVWLVARHHSRKGGIEQFATPAEIQERPPMRSSQPSRLNLGVDPFEVFRALPVFGTRRGRWLARQRNVEAFVEAHCPPRGDTALMRLAADLEYAHRCPVSLGEADGVDFDHARQIIVSQRQADFLPQRLNRQLAVCCRAEQILRLFGSWLLGGLESIEQPARLPGISSDDDTPVRETDLSAFLANRD